MSRFARQSSWGPLNYGCIAATAVTAVILSTNPPRAEENAKSSGQFTDEQRQLWSLKPVLRPSLPPRPISAANPIDAFAPRAAGLTPAVQADRRTLFRRLFFDLHGLPPDIDDVNRFAADPSPDAYERLTDRLLASPRLGERWARHWLDLVRYAETDGFKADVHRPSAWRYRDYVIAAFNADKPYDRFVAEQLAGDEIAPADSQAIVATGFLRHWPYEDNGRDVFAQRANILNDVTDVTGQVFLGLTVGCARCHDHKYDPILQRDYYRLQAFFAPMLPRDDVPIAAKDTSLADAQLDPAMAELRRQMDAIEAPVRQKMRSEAMQVFPKEVQGVLNKPTDDRTANEKIIADLAEKQLGVDAKALAGKMKKEDRGRWEQLKKKLDEATKGARPKTLPVAMAIRDLAGPSPVTTIPGSGTSEDVLPGFLTILDASIARVEPPKNNPNTTGRRMALAQWITSPENPLTARVAVNRLWQHHFGRGLVATSGDFGLQGERPTHPELLDYLAHELVRRAWSLKDLHRLMITSATYRQASSLDPRSRSGEHVEPLAPTLRRIEAEILRDSMLAASGELNLRAGGPSVFPDLPAELSARYGWKATPDRAEQNRRSIYVITKRNLRLPLFDAFDSPDTHQACCRRDVTTTAPQALMLLNDPWSLDRAKAMARRVMHQAGSDARKQISAAYETALSRRPDDNELRLAESFLSNNKQTALPDLCHALLNCNEFLYVD
jgi:hypothetical protein